MTESTLPSQVLHLKMENGASVSDWLGTAMSAASLASSLLEGVRKNEAPSIEARLDEVEAQLQQAIDEVFAVRHFVACRNEELRKAFERETAATQRLVADMEDEGLL